MNFNRDYDHNFENKPEILNTFREVIIGEYPAILPSKSDISIAFDKYHKAQQLSDTAFRLQKFGMGEYINQKKGKIILKLKNFKGNRNVFNAIRTNFKDLISSCGSGSQKYGFFSNNNKLEIKGKAFDDLCNTYSQFTIKNNI